MPTDDPVDMEWKQTLIPRRTLPEPEDIRMLNRDVELNSNTGVLPWFVEIPHRDICQHARNDRSNKS